LIVYENGGLMLQNQVSTGAVVALVEDPLFVGAERRRRLALIPVRQRQDLSGRRRCDFM
jgi:hypothetical protein